MSYQEMGSPLAETLRSMRDTSVHAGYEASEVVEPGVRSLFWIFTIEVIDGKKVWYGGIF